MGSGLNRFFSEFTHRFNIVKFSYQGHAFDYLKSLFKLEKNTANCQQIADSISTLSQQNINHFINSDHWSSRDLMDQVAQQASDMFAQENPPVALLIDEVGFRKKGKMSACVGRQYLGCIGKTDNGQVAVSAGLSQGRHFVPIDMRLFMPKAWEEDSIRRIRCNIPKSERHVSKPYMAQSMIEHAIDHGIKFDYVNFDALYGNATFLLEYLQDKNIDYIGDIRSNFTLYFSDDKAEKLRVDEYVARLSKDDFEKVNIRKSTKGILKASFHYARVQALLPTGKRLDLILLVRKDKDGKTKYSLSNMSDDHIQDLAQKQGQRIFVEQIFKEGKNLVGMGDYQIRGWHGFHNHMAICMMAMLLMAKIKLQNDDQNYTSQTIRKIINLFISLKNEKPNSALDIIFEQHSRYIYQLKKNGFINQET